MPVSLTCLPIYSLEVALASYDTFAHNHTDQFGVSPGAHTQDLSYTFNEKATPVPFPDARRILQQSVVSFVLNGVPHSHAGTLPKWGVDQVLLDITETGTQLSKSTVNKTRCAWWGNGEY
jgi:hypothetical protein